jgi:hypothetical protein
VGVLLLVVGFLLPVLWIVAVLCLVIGLVSGRADGELTVTWVPEAPTAPSPQPATAPAERSLENRLADLERLRASGVVTDEEYAAKRASILSEL